MNYILWLLRLNFYLKMYKQPKKLILMNNNMDDCINYEFRFVVWTIGWGLF